MRPGSREAAVKDKAATVVMAMVSTAPPQGQSLGFIDYFGIFRIFP